MKKKIRTIVLNEKKSTEPYTKTNRERFSKEKYLKITRDLPFTIKIY